MSYTTLTVDNLDNNAATIITKTIVGSGLTGLAAYSFTGVQDESFILEITNDGATGVATVYAGGATGTASNGGAYIEASSGNLDIVVGGGVTKAVVVEQARHRNQDATVRLGVGFTGSVYAYQYKY